ncbi:hypothetical protein [Frankia sp. AgB32]|uniref:SbtR family transcriptional regulator n=1 Tax=Frankia sp. AgB32 TaxID=631119 RepID=UPI0034D4052F
MRSIETTGRDALAELRRLLAVVRPGADDADPMRPRPVHRHRVEGLAQVGPALLANSATAHTALGRWIDLFVDFLVTKRGLAAVLQSDDPCHDPLHSYFLERLVPVLARLLDAAAGAGEIRPDFGAHELMRGVASLCAGAGQPDSRLCPSTGRDGPRSCRCGWPPARWSRRPLVRRGRLSRRPPPGPSARSSSSRGRRPGSSG